LPVHANTPRSSLDLMPSIRAIPFGQSNDGAAVQVLHRRHRLQLATIATRLSLGRGTILYREDMPLTSIFIVGQGVVKAFRDLPSGKRRITAFLLPEDIFGLAENGRYVNTAQTVSQVTLYRISYQQFTESLQRDPDLEFQLLSKVTHALRESQRHAIVTGRRDAAGRLAMFLSMLETHVPQAQRDDSIVVPMSRTDIANYLGLSLEAVSRASRELARKGIVTFGGRHKMRITDRTRFERIVTAF
jgi:CRP-like cAMP-binding protein